MKVFKIIAKKILPILISGGILFYLIYFTKPPDSWNQASTLQILGFFLPLLILVTFIVNLFFNYLPRSFIIGLAVMILVVLKLIDILNLLTAPAVILITIVSFYFFKKPKFTRVTKIPKLKHFSS